MVHCRSIHLHLALRSNVECGVSSQHDMKFAKLMFIPRPCCPQFHSLKPDIYAFAHSLLECSPPPLEHLLCLVLHLCPRNELLSLSPPPLPFATELLLSPLFLTLCFTSILEMSTIEFVSTSSTLCPRWTQKKPCWSS